MPCPSSGFAAVTFQLIINQDGSERLGIRKQGHSILPVAGGIDIVAHVEQYASHMGLRALLRLHQRPAERLRTLNAVRKRDGDHIRACSEPRLLQLLSSD